MDQYFLKLSQPFECNIDVKVDLSNYANKAVLKNASGVDESSFAKKIDLANLKSNVNKLNIDR